MSNLKSVFFCTAAAAFCLFSCKPKEEKNTGPKIIPVKVMDIALSNTADNNNFVGTVEEAVAVSLSFPVNGNVERVYVSEGQHVKKCQLLASLSTGTMKNAHDAALSSLKQAEDAYKRMSELHQKGSLPDIKMVEMETNLQQAKSMEAISRKNLEDSKLYAPISGIIAEKNIDEGMNAAPNLSVFKLVSIDNVDINVSIPENEIGSVKIGQEAIIKIPALDNKEYRGKIEKKGVSANPMTHTYNVKIRLQNNRSELMPGMVCKVDIPESSESRTVILPNKAVQISFDGKRFVWVVEGDSAKRQFITTGDLTDYGVTVENGLNEGQKVIVDGYHKVSEGMKVNIIQ